MVQSMKRSFVLVLGLMGCMGRASLGDQGSSSDPLSAAPDSSAGPGASVPVDAGESSGDDAGSPILSTDVEYVELDTVGPFVAPLRVDDQCRVTDGSGLNVAGDPARCGELFAVSVDPTPYGCGPNCIPDTCTGTIRVHLHDGRDLLRDVGADRCSVALPGVLTEKFAWGVWYGIEDGG